MTLYMPLFRCSTTLRTLTQLHAHLLIAGLHRDPQACTKLIESYAQKGKTQCSRLVFETFPCPDSFMWGVLIKCYVWDQFFEEAISLYRRMLYERIPFNGFVFPSVLRASSGLKDLGVSGEIHGRVIKSGFENDAVVQTSLLNLYGELGCLESAWKVFDAMLVRDVVSWSSIIFSCVENGEVNEGLKAFRSMVSDGIEPDSVTMLTMAEACGELEDWRLLSSVHGHVVRKSIESDGSLDKSLIVMYAKCGDLRSAEVIFRNATDRRTATWTAMISSHNQAGHFRAALDVFVEMLECKVEPNAVTMMGTLCSCARLGLFKEGKSIHCFVIRRDMDPDLHFLGAGLIELYGSSTQQNVCERILDLIGETNVVLWNILISVYAQKGLLKEALMMFVKMSNSGAMPDSFSLSSSLSASGNSGMLDLGRQIHGYIVKHGEFDEYVQNSLIDMYSKCGLVDLALVIFDEIESKSVVTWNSMISGFSQNGNSVQAIALFDEMYMKCLEIAEVAFLSAIQACSQLGYLDKGKWIHHKLITFGLRRDLYIETALSDMYAKCGELQTAQQLFDNMPEKSLVSWSTMIAGYGVHGLIDAVISVFAQMLESGLRPNDVIFMNVLSACSHAGLVEEGKFYFSSMRGFGIEPSAEHFACIVDLLSRSGNIIGAYEIILSMPFPATASIWGALLNGCRIHGRLDMIKSIDTYLSKIKPDDTGYYSLLSNIYAEAGNWVESGNVRSRMKDTVGRKVPGYSTIELGGKVYRFGAGDTCSWSQKMHFKFLDNLHNLSVEEANLAQCSTSAFETSIYSQYDDAFLVSCFLQ